MKRIQVSVDDEMYGFVMQLSELRGDSASRIINDLLEDYRGAWKREIRDLARLRKREDELAAEAERVRRRHRGEHQTELDDEAPPCPDCGSTDPGHATPCGKGRRKRK